jgi:hypothetical protein
MAVKALVVPTLDDYSDWHTNSCRQLVDFTHSLDYLAHRSSYRSLVAVFFGIGASDAAADGPRQCG